MIVTQEQIDALPVFFSDGRITHGEPLVKRSAVLALLGLPQNGVTKPDGVTEPDDWAELIKRITSAFNAEHPPECAKFEVQSSALKWSFEYNGAVYEYGATVGMSAPYAIDMAKRLGLQCRLSYEAVLNGKPETEDERPSFSDQSIIELTRNIDFERIRKRLQSVDDEVARRYRVTKGKYALQAKAFRSGIAWLLLSSKAKP